MQSLQSFKSQIVYLLVVKVKVDNWWQNIVLASYGVSFFPFFDVGSPLWTYLFFRPSKIYISYFQCDINIGNNIFRWRHLYRCMNPQDQGVLLVRCLLFSSPRRIKKLRRWSHSLGSPLVCEKYQVHSLLSGQCILLLVRIPALSW